MKYLPPPYSPHFPMLDFTPPMLTPTFSPASIRYPSMDQEKINPGHLYLRQQRTFEIIQLVEGPPPPPRQLSSVMSSSGASSSTCSTEYDDSDSYPSDEDCDSVCSSYCSSDEFPDNELLSEAPKMPTLDDTYSSRMKRVFAWRESFNKAMNITSPGMCHRALTCDLILMDLFRPSTTKAQR